MRCTLWMDSDTANEFIAMLDRSGYDENPDDAALAAVCISQTYTHQGSIDAGLARCSRVLQDLPSLLGESSQKFGTLPMLYYLQAHLQCAGGMLLRAEASNQMSVGTTGSDMDLSQYLSFKTSQLRRIVKKRTEETYVRLALPAGKMAVISIDISGKHDLSVGDANTTASTLHWDWKLEARDVDFHVSFLPNSQTQVRGEEIEVVPKTRHTAAIGPVDGVFRVPDNCGDSSNGGGLLELCFSNKHSYLRGKVVTYKLSLPPNAADPTCEFI
mmetsp:Transcript_30229/g.55693  ORF Transcript_30229/g.55693 Transcript_30229/m.55693 type:complete len:271 (-) Transcript_30229:326-1138(-)